MSFVRGQGSSEYLGLFIMMLLVAIVALAVVASFPDFSSGTTLQKSRNYWASAKPFAITNAVMIPNKLVLELRNTEGVTLTVRGIRFNGASLNFSNSTVPMSWVSDYRCAGGSCAMVVRPGQTQIVETLDFTSNPANPCIGINGFSEGDVYRASLGIIYSSTASGETFTQSGQFDLAGLCTSVGLPACTASSPNVGCCGAVTYTGSQKCCSDALPNYVCGSAQTCLGGCCITGSTAGSQCCTDTASPYACSSTTQICGGGSCVSCGVAGQACCNNNACNPGSVCSGGTCVSCGGPGQPCCSGSQCNPSLTCGGSPPTCGCGSLGAGASCSSGLDCHSCFCNAGYGGSYCLGN